MARPKPPSARTRVRAHPERAHYEPETVRAILAAGWVCHVAFVDDGAPVVVPTTYAPFESGIVLHGAAGGRMVARLGSGDPASIAVTLLDGLVLARSPMYHSMNYRSVVVFGRGVPVTEPARKRAALEAIVDHVVPGRRASLRAMTDEEIGATGVVWFDVTEASAKIRTGPSKDGPEDRDVPVWAGVLPLRLVAGEPEPDAWSKAPLPRHVSEWPLPHDTR